MATMAGGLYRRLATTRPVQEIDVIGIEDLSPSQLDRLDQSLALVREYGPWIYQHALEDLDGIGISQVGGPKFGGWVNFVWVSREWLDGQDEEWIAAAVVYAMTVARIRRALPSRRGGGFRRFRMAFERQLAFARRLPGGVLIVEQLTESWDRGFYSAGRQRELATRDLRKIGAPEWLIRSVKWLGVQLQRL
jgi:hypothetical protein